MQKSIIYLMGFVCYAAVVFVVRQTSTVYAGLPIFEDKPASITTSVSDVVDTSTITDPLRNGSRFGIESPDKSRKIKVIAIGEILSFSEAKNQTLKLVHNIINYALYFVALIVFVYLIYHGYKVVVAGTDEKAYKEALQKVRNSAIAIAGIALSRFIVTFIFYIINIIIS